MAAYSAADVKNLRERTGAGMMDCKKALEETNGDLEAAVDALRAKGLAAAQKKSSRTAAEGLVGVAVKGTRGVAVEVNSETDFVAKNDQFQDFVRKVTEKALDISSDDIEALKNAAYPEGGTVAEKLTSNVATIGENQQLRRMKTVSVKQGTVVAYMHNAAAPNLGKIGVLVALESEGDKGKLEDLGKQIAMHIAAAFPMDRPRYVVIAMLDEPKGTAASSFQRTAAWNAAPIVGAVVPRIGPLLGVMPDDNRDIDLTDLKPLVGKGGGE